MSMTIRRAVIGLWVLGLGFSVLGEARADEPGPLAQMPIVETGNVYFIGDDILIVVTTQAASVNYALEWFRVDRDSLVGGVYAGTAAVSDVAGIGRVAFLPTSMLTRKGVYFLSGDGITRRRILLVDPMPSIANARTWPFGLITSNGTLGNGAAMAEEFYCIGMRWFHCL